MSKYNIDNYSVDELRSFFGLNEGDLFQQNIMDDLDKKFNKIKTTLEDNNKNNPQKIITYINFLFDAKNKIVLEINKLIKAKYEQNQNVNQMTQWTAERDQMWIFDSAHRSKDLPQMDTQTDFPTTNYVYKFAHPEKDIESMELVSVTIPASWYIFDNIVKKNNVFKIRDNITDLSATYIEIPNGTYDISKTLIKINYDISSTSLYEENIQFILKEDSRKIDISYSLYASKEIIFYDKSDISFNQKNDKCNLGRILGFKPEMDSSGVCKILLSKNKNTEVVENIKSADTCFDLNTTKHLYIYLNDYNRLANPLLLANENYNAQNHLSDQSNKYYIENKVFDCCSATINASINGIDHKNLLVKLSNPQANVSRGSINSIIAKELKNIQNASTKITPFNPTQVNYSDILAVLPIMNYNALYKSNDYIVYFNDVLNNNKRMYNETTSLQNFEMRLYDDDGDVVNLNGLDWSFSVKVHKRPSSGITPN